MGHTICKSNLTFASKTASRAEPQQLDDDEEAPHVHWSAVDVMGSRWLEA